ncbi:Y-family DNA polymerase, partial [Staphylococcus arlettae]
MYDYNLLEERDVLCIDQKSFFASVSCLQKGLNPLTTKLAVVADTKRQGSVVLAATPALKALGIKTGSRLFEIPHRTDIFIINPSMRKYLEVSIAISKIALRYVPPEDLHQYSIDEFFIDVTDSYHRFSTTLHSFCERLR